MTEIVMMTTVGSDEQATRIARELVERRQAACVQVLPKIRSFYRWEGKVCDDAEILLFVKTLAESYDDAAATIRELHDYDVPESIALDIQRGDPEYLEWMRNNVG